MWQLTVCMPQLRPGTAKQIIKINIEKNEMALNSGSWAICYLCFTNEEDDGVIYDLTEITLDLELRF